MAEKNDDIKNLFLNLGLNPSDYHEIRTAPSANATVSEAPRRWSLLQAAAGKVPAAPTPLPAALAAALPPAAPAVAPAAAAAPVFNLAAATAATAITQPAPPRAPAPDSLGASSLSAALLAAAQDIARAEITAQPPPRSAPVPAAQIIPGALPAALADAFVQAAPADDLQSLFQSVKEPQTVSSIPAHVEQARPTERRTETILAREPSPLSPAARAATLAPPPSVLPMKAFMAPDEEPVTRHVPPSASRLGPVPSAPPPPAAPAGSGRLRFASAAAESAPSHGDSLRDVFRRLARDNRP